MPLIDCVLTITDPLVLIGKDENFMSKHIFK